MLAEVQRVSLPEIDLLVVRKYIILVRNNGTQCALQQIVIIHAARPL